MTYKPEWRGHLLVKGQAVTWDKNRIGSIRGQYVKGAKSPGGLETNTVYVATAPGTETLPFKSMTLAIEWLVELYKNAETGS